MLLLLLLQLLMTVEAQMGLTDWAHTHTAINDDDDSTEAGGSD